MTDTQQTPEQIAQESEVAFAAGFKGERGEPVEAPVEAPKTEPEAPAATATEAPKEEVIDEWAGVPQKVREELEALRQSGTKTPERLRTLEGHIGGLSSQLKELKAALATAKTAAEAKGGEAPTPEQVKGAMKDPDRWKQLKEDFPDWADALEPELADIRAQLAKLSTAAPPVDPAALKAELEKQLNERLAAATQDAEQKAQATEQKARTYAYLDLKHGRGWEAKIGTPQFEAWFAKQPKETQALSASASAEDASKLISLFDAHEKREAEKATREKRLDRASQPEGVQVTTTAEDPEDAFASGFAFVRGG